MGVILVVDERLSMVQVWRLDAHVVLCEAAHALLSQVVARLAVGLLRIYHFFQCLILHRGKQPKALPEEGRLGGVLLGVGRVTECSLV